MKRKETVEYSLGGQYTAAVPMVGTVLSIVIAYQGREYHTLEAIMTMARKTEGGPLNAKTLSLRTYQQQQTGNKAQVGGTGGTILSIGLEFFQTLIWWECQVIMTMAERTEDTKCFGPGLITGFLQTVESPALEPGIS